MEDHPILLFFSIAFLAILLCTHPTAAEDTVAANQTIGDGDSVVSAGGTYELGFFSPGESRNRYLGKWYKKISPRTVVWVANRDTPLTDRSGVLRLSGEGALQVVTSGGVVVWSSNSSVSSNPVARLLDSGNLVVADGSSGGDHGEFIWQSFDCPGDTLLPGMKLGKDLATGVERRLTSWTSPDDPAPGPYELWLDTDGFPQVFMRRGSVLQWRIGPWNGLNFRGLPMDPQNRIFAYEFVVSPREKYFKYHLLSSVLQRMHLRWDGVSVQLNWVERTHEWIVYGTAEVDFCGSYGLCGPYGWCSVNRYPPCSCMEGFEPLRPEEWNTADWSGGCRRKTPLECGDGDGDGFQRVSRVKFPDTRSSRYNTSMTLGECAAACKSDCNCTAYASLDFRNGGSGCLLWFDELMDVKEYDEKQELYVRMAASELAAHEHGSTRKKTVYATVLTISSAILVMVGLFIVVNMCRKRGRRLDTKRPGGWVHAFNKNETGIHNEDLDRLPFYTLYEVAKATDYFNADNMIGEGGFGPVYKGVLREGQKVAVKRLSKTSQQGLDEFKNEVICIAKLQHRNLVKLLGYCVHGDEMLLIYEYMANKSIDSFLFDDSRSPMLDWPRRFSIIQGIARGLLYLHQDSCLRIIHRDLKASNVLLDEDMNPKISDFGLARRFVGYDSAAKTKKVVGTYGYISPEYAVHGRFSIKSDVFSFGVLVLEIVSGRKNREYSYEDHSGNLLGHAWRLYKENKSLELMSPSLRESRVVSQVLRSINVGLLCVQHHAQDRPTMSTVVVMLDSEVVLSVPKQPAFFSEEGSCEPDSVSSVDEATITILHAR